MGSNPTWGAKPSWSSPVQDACFSDRRSRVRIPYSVPSNNMGSHVPRLATVPCKDSVEGSIPFDSTSHMTSPTVTSGTKCEAAVLAALVRTEAVVLVPFGVARYDLAFDDGNGIKTVQCKSGRMKNGSVRWNAHSVDRSTHVKTHYRDQVDFFGVWVPETSKTYLVPVTDVPTSEGCLRVDPARNGQVSGVRWANQYEI